MDLIGGYLLILLVLFATNVALMLGNYKLDNFRLIVLSLGFFAFTFILMNVSGYLNVQLSFLLDNFSYLFLIVAIAILASVIYYIRKDNFRLPLAIVSLFFIVSTIFLSSQANLDFLTIVLYSLFVFIILFVVYQLTKLLHHAKRQYPVIVGEYMSLFSILVFIFALTYNSTRTLDYTMFSPFLILTPTYQLIYVVIGIVVVLVVGVLINDTKGGNK